MEFEVFSVATEYLNIASFEKDLLSAFLLLLLYSVEELNRKIFSVDKKNQLDVTFYILYFSSNSCSTCFGQPCVHHQELTTA